MYCRSFSRKTKFQLVMSLSLLKSVILLLFHLVLVRALLNSQNTEQHNYNRKDEILSYLFQNRTNIFNTDERHALRKLPIVKTPYDAADPVQCVVCPVGKMNYCSIVGGKLIQEVYYPKNPAFLESCNVLESLGKRMYDEIFGVGKTFRDTPQCRGKLRFLTGEMLSYHSFMQTL